MDDKANNITEDSTVERSEEEVAWDKEFKEEKDLGLTSAIADLVKLAVKVPVAIIQMPMNIIPQETARHTRAAFRETFLAFRSLLGAIGDGIENMLAEPAEKPATVRGPEGTWGTARTASSATGSTTSATSTGGRLKPIEWSDDDTPDIPAGIGEYSEADAGDEEGRGLRADIDY
jgi:hypothetical protein